MAKFFNNIVKTGKLAGSVFSVRNGVTIERAYQPMVLNPNTPGQVASRAKFKLLTQLATVAAPFIAIPREGMVSSRNLFTKLNYPAATYSENGADIELTDVKLTKSVVSLPAIDATRAPGILTLALANNASSLSRVVYVAFVVTEDNELRAIGSAVTSEAGTGGTYQTTMSLENMGVQGRQLVVYAYGVRDNTEAARVTFGNIQVVTAESVARVITSRMLLGTDVTVTETKGVIVPPVS